MAKSGIFKISHGKTVRKWNALFRVEKNPLLRKDKRQLPYFPVANWYIDKAIHKYDQESIDTLRRHRMHMYIHDTLIPTTL